MKQVEIHVPNKSYNGVAYGVSFTNGVGICTDIKKAELLSKQLGYVIVEVSTKVDTEIKVETEVKPAPKKRTRKKAEPKAGE